jgi:hypothetical protein
MGYARAGFEVEGVDHRPQARYPFAFHLGDAFAFPLDGFDVIHASPPCQAYSKATAWRGSRSDHPDLIGAVRERLSGRRYVLETVEDGRAWLQSPVRLCGSAFGLPVRRHRFFEIGGIALPMLLILGCRHNALIPFDHGGRASESAYRDAMGVTWMTVHEARQAIPPAYTAWLGGVLLRELRRGAQ